MPEFIYQLSCPKLFIFLIFVLLAISFVSISLVRRYIPLDFRYKENTAIVSCSALLGIIYAVLIGFIILYQFGSFDQAERAENSEGSTLHSIYHDVALLPAPYNSKLQSLVVDYTQNVLDNEWPALDLGEKVSSKGKMIIENMLHEIQLINVKSLGTFSTDTLSRLEQEIIQLFKLHHQRTSIVHTTLNGHVWFVLLLATFFTLGVNFFLGMDFYLHIFCITLIAMIMTALIYLIVGLDRPYQGDFAVHPDTIQSVLEEKDLTAQKT